MSRDFKPVHPGIILKEIIDELGISQARLAHDIDVTPMRISHVIKGTRPVTGELALKLGKYFRQDPQFWLNLQTNYEMRVARAKIGKRLEKIHPYTRTAAHAIAS
jgi:addiction module HigA family antidote